MAKTETKHCPIGQEVKNSGRLVVTVRIDKAKPLTPPKNKTNGDKFKTGR